ncbi:MULTISPECIES: protein phosphatase 2C domain-containing protein [unclassified Maridesulfovibrio]|uniref:protein phosphatase 2C domain-containing protein n=1 Tax=unclassified Maridesulfovibrio TaxID=2794999 RepID=UPI003B3D2804
MHVESLIEHGTGVINEDFLVMEDNLFGVFDGATSLTSETYENGHTGGFLASNLAGEEFRKNHGTMQELAERANRVIRQEMVQREVNLASKRNLWSTSAAVVRVKGDVLEWAQIGDCRIVCIYKSGDFEFLCQCADQDMETLSMWKEVGPSTEAPIGVALHDQIAKVRCRMNLDYGVFNGEPEAINFLKTGNHDLTNVSNILLFTDGLLMPNEKPWEERAYSEQVDLFRQSGLKGLRDQIRNIEATDLNCCTYPRFKTHDDIAAVAINL